MKYRTYRDSDYLMLCQWLEAMDWPPVPKQSLPPYGFVVLDNDCSVAMGFIYLVDDIRCDSIYPSWIVFNSDMPYKKILKAMDYMAYVYEDVAKKNGKTNIQVTLKTEAIINRLHNKHGYYKSETNVTRLVKYIEPHTIEDGIFWFDQEGIDYYFPDSPFTTKAMQTKEDCSKNE